MAVDAIELKPRGVVAIFDSAIRLCARTSGLWALTLPAGAALAWAGFALAEAHSRHHATLLPAIALAAAWIARAIGMGAACHYAQTQLLSEAPPSTTASLKAALARAPSLIVTAAFCLLLNALILTLTVGVGFLFFGAHQAAYAVTMQGQGPALAVYQTSARLLGPARQTGALIRTTAVVQVLAFFNLHIAVQAAVWVAKNLLALNLSFLSRFASLDNPVWLVLLAAVTFALFEPVRAAVSALLLVDGRVRQEGLDLKAAVEQLPQRQRRTAGAAVAGLLVLLCGATSARAEPPPHDTAGDDWSGVYFPGQPAPGEATSAMRARLQAIVDECELTPPQLESQLESVDALAQKQPAALNRFVARLERLMDEEDGCDTAAASLGPGLELIAQTDATAAERGTQTRQAAAAILARPEFEVVQDLPKVEAEPKPEAEAPGWFSKWWDELWEAIGRWLRNQRAPNLPDAPNVAPLGGSLGLSNLIIPLAIALVLALIFVLVVKLRGERGDDPAEEAGAGPSVVALEADPMSALTRPPETWAGLADELAAKGEFREAIRHLYLALLSRLHRDGAIDYDPAKSNWDYLRAFKGPTGWRSPFKDLTRRFDFAWYGRQETDPDAWRTFRSITEPLLIPAAEASAGA